MERTEERAGLRGSWEEPGEGEGERGSPPPSIGDLLALLALPFFSPPPYPISFSFWPSGSFSFALSSPAAPCPRLPPQSLSLAHPSPLSLIHSWFALFSPRPQVSYCTTTTITLPPTKAFFDSQ